MILQFSKLPPPLGGVSIHVSRLVSQIKKRQDFSVDVLDYSKEKWFKDIIRKLFFAKIVHIHLSNKKMRFIFSLFFILLFKRVIITYHGKYDFKNRFDRWALRLSSASILLNEYSYLNAKSIRNENVYKIGAFIPPSNNEIVPLKEEILSEIQHLKNKYDKLFCTSASSLAYDDNDEEIYMGSHLVTYFQNKKDIALVFSCPNDDYSNFLKEKFEKFPDNIFFISEKHDFVNVIKNTDALIRATTTDGDSLSIKEALYYRKQVFATTVIDRPKGVILFSDLSDFDKIYSKKEIIINNIESNFFEIYMLYESLLK